MVQAVHCGTVSSRVTQDDFLLSSHDMRKFGRLVNKAISCAEKFMFLKSRKQCMHSSELVIFQCLEYTRIYFPTRFIQQCNSHHVCYAYSYAYTFYTASFITGNGVEKIHRLIEEAAAQADEVDEKYLQVMILCRI